MATYDDNAAATELENSEPSPDSGDSKTVSVPRESLPACKPGDTYRVVSADDDMVQLEPVGGPEPDESETWAADFRKHMGARNGEPMSDSLREQMT